MHVLVTDGDTRSALAAVRSLGRGGHVVTVAGHRYPCLASSSRYAAAFERCPDPAKDPSDFVTSVLDIVHRRPVDVVLPMTEITTLLVTEIRAQLPSGCLVPFPDAAAVAKASDKAYVVRLAERLGVPTPQTVILSGPPERVDPPFDLPYPVVVKPARSRVRVGAAWISTGVSYARNSAALLTTLRELPAEVYPVLLQERIHGPGKGIFACFSDGRPIALFAHRRIREKPPTGGVSVLCESIPLDQAAAEHATLLLSTLEWRGVAMVEFKQDQRDGLLRLMEINGRFWGSLQLAIDAGVDFPAIAAGAVTGEWPSNPAGYRVGVRSRWLAGDLDSLLMAFLHSDRDLDFSSTHPAKLRMLWDFLHFWGRDMHYEIEQADDLAPARLTWRRHLTGS